MTTARLAAARTLLSLERGRTTMAAEAERERTDIPDSRDRALFLEIAAGTVRWRNELDACIAASSRRPIADLSPEVRAVLRTATYQLLHLDRVPAHAAVSEAVETVRALGQPHAAGFVNAVLRKVSHPGARRALPPRPEPAAGEKALLDYLSVTLSHPRWLVKRWLDRIGFDATARWCQFNNTSPTVAVRLPIRGKAEALLTQLREADTEATPTRFAADVVQLAAGGLGRLPTELRQSVIVQDEGSVLVAMAAQVEPGETVLDVCAAPGGKTLLFADHAGPDGLVVAADIRRARVSLLRDSVRRAAVRVPVLAADAAAGLPFGPVFDCVVLDAPCSGLGTLRRDPDIKWSRLEQDLEPLAATQARMIDHAAQAVRSGGRLIYSTCSSEPEENEQVVEGFLARRPDFRVEAIAAPIPSQLVTTRGFLQTAPARDELDAFYAAKLVRSKGA